MIQEQELTDLQQELADLQRKFEQLKREVKSGITGPRGPAGDALYAAREATTASRTEFRKAIKDVSEPFKTSVESLRLEFQTLKAYIDETTEAVVANTVVRILCEYGLLDSDMNPINKAHLETHLKRLGLLK